MLPDIYHILDFIINRMTNILDNLVINTSAMANNIAKANELYFSQVILLTIIKNNPKITREIAYDFIQKCTLEAQNKMINFKDVLIKNNINQYLTSEQLNECCNNNIFLINVDYIFKKFLKINNV